jgi:hypothetical protein
VNVNAAIVEFALVMALFGAFHDHMATDDVVVQFLQLVRSFANFRYQSFAPLEFSRRDLKFPIHFHLRCRRIPRRGAGGDGFPSIDPVTRRH